MGRSVRRPALLAALATAVLLAAPAAAFADDPAPPDVGTWVKLGERTFGGSLTSASLLDALRRGQGVAVDGDSFVFSGNTSLLRTGVDATTVQQVNASAIPSDLSAAGSNHIGDGDVDGGTYWAPIEDGAHYANPELVLFDAHTLKPTGTRYALGTSLLTDGVPWVAVDRERSLVYTAPWNGTTALQERPMADPTQATVVPLSEEVDRIQGAKVLDGLLYAAQDDDAAKSIVAIDPDTGVVTPVFDRDLGASLEAEGIAFRTTAACGTVLYSLANDTGAFAVRLTAYGRMPVPAGCNPLPDPPVVTPPTTTTTITPTPTVTTPAPDPKPEPKPKPKPAKRPALAKVTAAALAKARVQVARGTSKTYRTLRKRTALGRSTYAVRVRSGSANLATGTLRRRALTLKVAKGTSAAKRARVRTLVRGRIRDARSVSVKMG